MDTTEGIAVLKEKVAGTQDAAIFQDEEQILFDTVAAALRMVTAQDVIDTLKGNQTAPKKRLCMDEAINALNTLHLLGKKYDVNIPIYEEKTEFGLWLITDYGKYILKNG